MHSFQLKHGNPPIVDPGISTVKMKLHIQQALKRRYLFHGWEALTLETFIFSKWDHGALRTYCAYFHDDIEQGEACLLGTSAHTMVRTIVSGSVSIQAQLLCILLGSIGLS
jgi:hypothetical protein